MKKIKDESLRRAESLTMPAVETARNVFVLYLREGCLLIQTNNTCRAHLYTNAASCAAILINDNVSHYIKSCQGQYIDQPAFIAILFSSICEA
jgi:hypothetical protein